MSKHEQLWSEGQKIIENMKGLTGIVQNEMEYTADHRKQYTDSFRQLHLDLMEWDEKIYKFISWKVEENKR